MTNRAQLVAIALEHQSPGVEQILTAIYEAHIERENAEMSIKATLDCEREGRKSDLYAGASIVEAAMKKEVAEGKLRTLFFTLACVLQAAGVDVDF